MARGHIGGSRRLQFDPSAFLQGGGGGKNDPAMEMAMAIMGYGGRGASPEELGLSREQLMANIAHQGAGEDIERQRLALEEKRLGSQEGFQNWQKKAEADRALAELGYKKDLLESEKQKSRDTVIGKYLDLEQDPAKRRSLIDALSPEAKADTLGLQKAKEDATVRTQAPALADAYKRRDWKTVKDIVGTLSPEVLSRPEFKWGEWNQAAPAPGTGKFSGGKGLLGMMWNTPGALQNVGKGIANLLSTGVLGDEAPQVPYTEFTSPTAYRAQQLAQGGPPQEGPVRSEAPLSLASLLESVKSPTGPVVSEPPIDVLGAERRFPKVSALPPSAFPSVEDLIARSQFGAPPAPPPETSVSVDDLARLVAPPIAANQPATGGEEELLNQGLASLVAPNLSAIQESQYAPPAAFPRQMRQPGFEYQAGGPSAVPGPWLQPERERYPTGAAGPLDWRAILGL
jgi:hypothetical protein